MSCYGCVQMMKTIENDLDENGGGGNDSIFDCDT